jgi:hypothetical protein
VGDELDFDKIMGFQRASGFNQVDDPIGQTDNRRELDRSIKLDEFDRHTTLIKVSLRHVRILCRNSDFRRQPFARFLSAERGDRNSTRSESQIQWLVDVIFLFQQDVLAANSDIGRSIFDIRRHVRRPHNEKSHSNLRAGEDEPAAIRQETGWSVSRSAEEFDGRIEEFSFGQGDR